MKALDAKETAGVAGGELLGDALAPEPTATEWDVRWDYPGDPTPLT